MFTVALVDVPWVMVMSKAPWLMIPVIFFPSKRVMVVCSCAKVVAITQKKTKRNDAIFFIMLFLYSDDQR